MRHLLFGTAVAAVLLAGSLMHPAKAQSGPPPMPYIGQIMLVPYTFCPAGWMQASGQLLQITQNNALFALLGTNYGGDGRTTFALPSLPLVASANGATLRQCIAVTGSWPTQN